MTTTAPSESLMRRIRHARANIRHAEELRDCMDADAWRILMDSRHAELNDLIDQITKNATSGRFQ